MPKIERILVPTDGSRHALKAAEYTADIAKKYGSEVQLLNVMTVPVEAGKEKVSRKILQRTKGVFDKEGVKVVVRDAVYGHPAETICNVIEKEKFDLVIMGSRGLSEIKAFFMGGISDKVSHHAVCPVLIVR